MPILASAQLGGKRRRPGWLTVALSLLVLGAVVGAVVMLALYRDPREVQTLQAPGAIVRVTYGDEPLLLGADWQKWLLRLNPTLGERFGGQILGPGFGKRNTPFTIWWTVGRAMPNTPSTWQGVFAACTLIDERGERMGVLEVTGDLYQVGEYWVCTFPIDAFPRRGKQIRLRLETVGMERTPEPLREYVLSNPTPGSYPVWTGEPLPAHRRTGRLEVILDQFQASAVASQSSTSGEPGYLDLRLREEGRPALGHWRVTGVVVRDPTGNTWKPTPWLRHSEGDRVQIDLLGGLVLSDEPAYRIRVELEGRGTEPRSVEFLAPATRHTGQPGGVAHADPH